LIKKYFKVEEAMEILEHKDNIIEFMKEKALELKNKKIEGINTEYDEDGFITRSRIEPKRLSLWASTSIGKGSTSWTL